MRKHLTFNLTYGASGSSKAILLASVALLVSAVLQAATTWMQMRSRGGCEERRTQFRGTSGQMFSINENDYSEFRSHDGV